MLPRPVERLAPILLIAVSLMLAFASQRGESVTVDEYAHLPAGCAALRRGELELYSKTPPLARYLLAVPAVLQHAAVPPADLPTRGGGWDPWRYGDAFLRANAGAEGLGHYPSLLLGARLVGMALGACLLWLLFAWARRLHGPAGGLTSLFLLAFSPTFLAHSKLATVDVAASLAMFLAAWLVWRAHGLPSVGRWALAGAGIGAALTVKFTAVLLVPLLVLWAALARWVHRAGPESSTGRSRTLRGVGHAVAFGACALLVIQLTYQLQEPLGRLDSFRLDSRAGGALAALLPGWMPVPLPGAMVRGMDAQLLDLEQADFPNYVNGEWYRQGRWYYYPWALLLKTPLALWGMIPLAAALALLAWRARRGKPPAAPDRQLGLWMAATTFATLLLVSLGSNLNIGIRYLLPAFPFLYLLLGNLGRRAATRPMRVAVATLLLAYGGATLRSHPHYLTFFNTLAGGPAGGWRYLANSNNDWGQDLPQLVDWLARHPQAEPIYLAYFGPMDPARYGIDYRLPPDHPVPGLHVVSLNLLLGLPYVIVDHGRWVPLGDDLRRPQTIFAWMREREPVARLGWTLWVFRVEGPVGGHATAPDAVRRIRPGGPGALPT